MHREYGSWSSPHLGRMMEYLIFGRAGRPVLLFPTSMGRFFQYEDFGMIAALGDRIDSGQLQVFCVDSVDGESWYNRSIPPRDRALRHLAYEAYLFSEFVPFLRDRNGAPLLAAGCSFGAFHACNFALRRPDCLSKMVALSGMYDLRHMTDGYFDVEWYLNSPVDYLEQLENPAYLDRFRQMRLVFASGDATDICYQSTLRLSSVLSSKGVPHELDIWPGANHDWPVWKEMARRHFC